MARKLPVHDTSATPLVRSLSDLGKLVRNQRALGQLRIDDAAALSFVSSDLLSRLENGKPVTLDKLLRVLDGLGLRMVVVPTKDIHPIASLLSQQNAATGEPPHE
jgi:transcriptional regulator with XRE-family HTH domain